MIGCSLENNQFPRGKKHLELSHCLVIEFAIQKDVPSKFQKKMLLGYFVQLPHLTFSRWKNHKTINELNSVHLKEMKQYFVNSIMKPLKYEI